ncbi:hypothetical protein INR49_021806 [Caranx melampygus]|nr:hypothetical protein INR49_021806 [Caranx melampygus]
MSTPADAPNITTVFDDGRKSIHAVGGTGCQPSSEELGQILSVIDGVGMTALLDEVTVVPNSDTEMKIEHVEVSRTPEEKVVSLLPIMPCQKRRICSWTAPEATTWRLS